eukprot:7155601-Pyramimonas_sp.AAC.1
MESGHVEFRRIRGPCRPELHIIVLEWDEGGCSTHAGIDSVPSSACAEVFSLGCRDLALEVGGGRCCVDRHGQLGPP